LFEEDASRKSKQKMLQESNNYFFSLFKALFHAGDAASPA